MRRLFVIAALAAAVSIMAAAQERVVNVYNWSDYIDPQLLEDFTDGLSLLSERILLVRVSPQGGWDQHLDSHDVTFLFVELGRLLLAIDQFAILGLHRLWIEL